MNSLLKTAAQLLTKRSLTLSICESCTGGMLASLLTSLPGSSKYFWGGIIAYANQTKERIVGVRPGILKKYGAVSAETAKEMANGVRRKLDTDIGVSITGIAGPSGGTKKKPVGLVYIAIANRTTVIVKKILLSGNRQAIRKKACQQALRLLIEWEKNNEGFHDDKSNKIYCETEK